MALIDAKKKPGFWWRRMFLWMSFGALAGRGMLQFCQKYWPAEHTLRAIETSFRRRVPGLNHRFGHSGRTACLISKVSSMRDRALRYLVQMNYSVNG
jgi:hypothetical protein